MMAKTPVPGVVWQTLHYLIGFRRLGFDPYYVETHAHALDAHGERVRRFLAAGGRFEEVMRRFDMGDRWAYHVARRRPLLRAEDTRLRDLYKEAELVINLHGGTKPHAELCAAERLVYLETDPVRLQIELHDGVQSSFFLEPHSAFFTFAENLGRPGCELPVCDRFPFRPTRQPVVQDLWAGRANGEPESITTVGNGSRDGATFAFAARTTAGARISSG